MSYELEAIIGLAEPIRKSCQGIENAHAIPLAQGLAMIPWRYCLDCRCF
jgi:hypothetical protein